jgi:hypothetical protein
MMAGFQFSNHGQLTGKPDNQQVKGAHGYVKTAIHEVTRQCFSNSGG